MSWGGGGSSVVTDFGAPNLFHVKADLPWCACPGCGFQCLHTRYMSIAPVQYTSGGVEIAAWGKRGRRRLADGSDFRTLVISRASPQHRVGEGEGVGCVSGF